MSDQLVAEVRASLDTFHAAQKAGDIDAMVDDFTARPQGITHGMPRPMEGVRRLFAENVDVFKARQADMSAAVIEIAREPGAYQRYVDGELVGVSEYALVQGVKYTGATAIGVGVPTGRPSFPDPLHVNYVMVKEADGIGEQDDS